MDPVIGAALISGGSNLLSGVFQSAAQSSANATNIQLARENREWQESMWQKQNEYNTPAAQIQRMREAGLNPALMYSQGNVGNAGSVGSAPVAQVQPVTGFAQGIGAAGDTIANAVMQYEQVKQMRANTRLLESKAAQTEANTFEPQTYRQLINAKLSALTHQGSYYESKAIGQDTYNRHASALLGNQVRHGELSNSELNLRMYMEVAKFQLDVANYQLRKKMTDAQAGYYYKLSSLAEQKYNFLDNLNPEQIKSVQAAIANYAARTNLTNKELDNFDVKLGLQIVDRILRGVDILTPDMMPVMP